MKGHSTFDVFRGVFQDTALPLKSSEDFVNASLYFELKTFLHGLLVVEDKVSMAHSMETRVPFLDNDLVDFACRLPAKYKLSSFANAGESVDEDDVSKYQSSRTRTTIGKVVLRKAMQRLIPLEITNRAKQGFSAPDASWFRGESIDYVNRLLRDPKAKIYSYLQRDYVVGRLDEHTSGRANHRLFIWSLLSFEWWLRRFIDPE
jgi:asparagine synthase (glutamine-hydrolysing)